MEQRDTLKETTGARKYELPCCILCLQVRDASGLELLIVRYPKEHRDQLCAANQRGRPAD
jgi:hypothetical protein